MAAPAKPISRAHEIVAITLLIVCSGLLAASPVSARATVRELAARLAEARRSFESADVRPPRAGEPTTTRQVTAGVISIFLQYVQTDLDHDELERAERELGGLRSLIDRLKSPSPTTDPKVLINSLGDSDRPGERRLKVQGSSIVAALPDGTTKPVFLVGYGLFNEWRNDLEKMPSVGANIVQIEIGPDKLFPKPDSFDKHPLEQLVSMLDRAATAGVAVDLLLSPHYFPAWLLERQPALRVRREGFVQYCIHHPVGREFLSGYVREVIGAIKNHPALLSVCLANEPMNIEEPCETATRDWHEWLRKSHGSVAEFNAAHQTRYRTLEQIELPNSFDPPQDRALWLDYVRFNQEEHTNWLQLLAQAVHEVAPDLPVHVKALTPLFTGRTGNPSVGLDPTLLARISDLNGNDGGNGFAGLGSEFAQDWLNNALGHDMQKSQSPAPIINSENHLIDDTEERVIPAMHVRTALWQAAVHGQAATTIWLWARSTQRTSNTLRTILEQPLALDAVSRVNLDMNRVASELVTLQKAPADVTILYSSTSQVWDTRATQVTNAIFTALSFMGVKISFVTERQLENGREPDTRILFVPGMVHLSSSALSQLAHYAGRIVFVGGRDLLTRDEHDRPVILRHSAEVLGTSDGTSWHRLWNDLTVELPRWAIEPSIAARTPKGDSVWGIEWRSARAPDGSWLVNLVNYRKQAVALEMLRDGKRVNWRDVLTAVNVPQPFVLGSLETRLVRLAAGQGQDAQSAHVAGH